MEATCRIESCNYPVTARGLCRKHYYGAKNAGTLDEIAPNPSGPCEHCGQSIPKGRRWGAKFCSPDCKQKALDAAAHRKMLERREHASRARQCGWCREPLTVLRHDQRFCSRKCNDDWSNDQRRISDLRARKATRKPCKVCGNAIPDERNSRAIYCSIGCKILAGRSGHESVRRDQQAYNRQYLYGITSDEFDAMLLAQDGRCAICRSDTWPGKGNRPHIDHCHKSGKIRGLLCGKCNVALGNLDDDPARLRAAAEYLETAATPVPAAR